MQFRACRASITSHEFGLWIIAKVLWGRHRGQQDADPLGIEVSPGRHGPGEGQKRTTGALVLIRPQLHERRDHRV